MLFHHHTSILSRASEKHATGRSVVAAAAYRAGCRIDDHRLGMVFAYRKPEVGHSEIMAPEGAPAWVHDRSELWNRVERSERRCDAQLARDVEFALPHGIPKERAIAMVRDYFAPDVAMGETVDWSLHMKSGNWHVHGLKTMRPLDGSTPTGFSAKKDRTWNDRGRVDHDRLRWENVCNRELTAQGRMERVSRLSLAEQGIDRLPQIHVGAAAWGMAQRGIPSDRWTLNEKIKEQNRVRAAARRPRPSKTPAHRAPRRDRLPRRPSHRVPVCPPHFLPRPNAGARPRRAQLEAGMGTHAPSLTGRTPGQVQPGQDPGVAGSGVDLQVLAPHHPGFARGAEPTVSAPSGGMGEAVRGDAVRPGVGEHPSRPTPGLAIPGRNTTRLEAGASGVQTPGSGNPTGAAGLARVDKLLQSGRPAGASPDPVRDGGRPTPRRDAEGVAPGNGMGENPDDHGGHPAHGRPGGPGSAGTRPPAPPPVPSVPRDTPGRGLEAPQKPHKAPEPPKPSPTPMDDLLASLEGFSWEGEPPPPGGWEDEREPKPTTRRNDPQPPEAPGPPKPKFKR